MAPSPAKRVTRSANAKDSRKRASRKATPTDSGYGGSEESWQPSHHNGGEELDTSEDPLVHRPKDTRATTPQVQGISPIKRKSNLKQPKLATDPRTSHGSSSRGSPSKMRQVGKLVPNKDSGIKTRQPNKQLRSKTPANIPDLHHQHHIDRSLDPKYQADSEVEQAFKYFAKPKNRSSQHALEAFFSSQPEHPQTDEAYKHRYQALRSAAWDWTKEYFSDVACASSPPLDLMHLLETNPELMEYINSTTSSPHFEVWERILQLKRAEIVYSIVGKVLEMHVFGKELFGATPEEERLMQVQDYRMRDSD
ncbi:MAG: hypothetical protein Q9216_006675, partial [Gyalolechia sp. 2 TL-2023]